MKVILAAWSLGLQAGARGVELPEKKVSGGEREFSYSFVTFKPEVDLHSPLFYVGTYYVLHGITQSVFAIFSAKFSLLKNQVQTSKYLSNSSSKWNFIIIELDIFAEESNLSNQILR